MIWLIIAVRCFLLHVFLIVYLNPILGQWPLQARPGSPAVQDRPVRSGLASGCPLCNPRAPQREKEETTGIENMPDERK